jgi:hypothetical protein
MRFCLPRRFLPVSVCVTQILVVGGTEAVAAFPPAASAPHPHPPLPPNPPHLDVGENAAAVRDGIHI